MKERNKITVKIADQEYTIIANEPREYMHTVIDYVDKKIDRVIKQNSRLNTTMAAVLTAINTTDDYFKLKKKEEELMESIADYTRQVDKLKQEIERMKKPKRK